jgi:beta-glucosidase
MTEAGTFRDRALPLSSRVSDLLCRLTLEEKVGLLHQHQAPVPRLEVGPFRTGTEALHGLAWLGPATVFPQAIGLASTWSPDLVRQVGAAVGDEVRGSHHKDPSGAGLNVWAPVVNPLRDPRWGRNEEGYAEDPWLTGVMATAYAHGLRGDHPEYLKTAPTLKHFLGYNNETRRDSTSSGLSPRVLREYELPAFRPAIAAGAAVAVMASYNLVNGRPAHLSPLINSELRRWADGELLVVSDAHAPSNIVDPQRYYPDHAASHAALLRAGVDSFTDHDDRSPVTVKRITEALHRGLLTEDDVDRALRHSLTIRFRLGEFDPPEENPYAAITEEVVNSPEHQALAREAARRAIVLLKNAGATLPLGRVRRLAVLGPLADTLYEDWYSGSLPYAVTVRRGLAERLSDTVHFVEGVDRVALLAGPGLYVTAAPGPHGEPLCTGTGEIGFDLVDWGRGVHTLRAASNGRYVTVGEDGVLRNAAEAPGQWVVRETFRLVERADGELVLGHIASGRYVTVGADGVLRADATAPGDGTGLLVELIVDGVEAAVAEAAAADVAIVVLGNHPLINGRETEDRADLRLPPGQDRLLRAVRAANPATVLVVTSSYPYGIGWADEHVPAILWSAHGGQEFGHALAEVLLGDVSPAGRLTQTWYRSAADLPDLLDYDIIATDSTYLYHRGTPLYPFGHGLTYSPVEYADLKLSTVDADGDTVDTEADGVVTATVTVTNTGGYPVDEVVQLYTRQRRSRVKQPQRQLRGFRRVHLEPGQAQSVRLELAAADLGFWDVTRDRYVVEAARHVVLVGRSSTDLRQAATLSVRGERIPPRDPLVGPILAVNHDDYADVTLVDASRTDGDAVAATEPGAWIRFADVDLGRPVAGWVARVGAVTPGQLTLRLDDPLDGPVFGTLVVDGRGVAGEKAGRYDWARVSGPVEPAGGVRDLYVVFDSPRARLWDFSFIGPTSSRQAGPAR